MALSIEKQNWSDTDLSNAPMPLCGAHAARQTRNLFAGGRLPSNFNIIIIIIVSPSNRGSIIIACVFVTQARINGQSVQSTPFLRTTNPSFCFTVSIVLSPVRVASAWRRDTKLLPRAGEGGGGEHGGLV